MVQNRGFFKNIFMISNFEKKNKEFPSKNVISYG